MKKRYIGVPYHDRVVKLKFYNGEAIQSDAMVNYIISCEKYKDLIPFLNHQHSYDVLVQNKKLHDWDIYPHVDPKKEDGMNFQIIYEYDEKGKVIFEPTDHSFNILEDRNELDIYDKQQLKLVLSTIDFLTSNIMRVDEVNEKGNIKEHKIQSYQLFLDFFKRYNENQDLNGVLFEYLKLKQLFILRDLFPKVTEQIDQIIKDVEQMFDSIYEIVKIRHNEAIQIDKKLNDCILKVVSYDCHTRNNFDKSLLATFIDEKVVYDDINTTIKSIRSL